MNFLNLLNSGGINEPFNSAASHLKVNGISLKSGQLYHVFLVKDDFIRFCTGSQKELFTSRAESDIK